MKSIERAVMPTIWVIRSVLNNKESNVKAETVCLKNNLILTCDHGFGNGDNLVSIRARRLNDTNFHYKMSIAYGREDWDLALLKFQVDPGVEFEYLLLSEDQVLTVDDRIHAIGHAGGLSGSFVSGFVVKPCEEIDPSTFKEVENYRYVPEKKEVSHTRPALMKDFHYAEDGHYDIHPDLPIIMVRMRSGQGFSGGPFFRDDCKIVGILLFGEDSITSGVHLSALKEFLKEADENVSGSSAPGTSTSH